MKSQESDSEGWRGIAGLAALDRDELVMIWKDELDTEIPKGMSRSMILRILAWELQAKTRGSLKSTVKRELLRALENDRQHSGTRTAKPGARLVREWNGRTHVVEVLDSGFKWEGRTYRSLSAIARDITGTRWSGPRFFGLAERPR